MKIANENKKIIDIDNYENDKENNHNDHNDDINTSNNNDNNIVDEKIDENINKMHKNPIRHIIYLRNLKIKQTVENSQIIYNPRRGLDRGKPLLFLSEVKDVYMYIYVS
jgi:hypothetical protein